MENKNIFKPLVSVIVLVQNGQENVCDSIDSAIDQKYTNIEIIVINYGNNNNIEKLIKSYGNRIRYFKNNTNCFTDAICMGIGKSKGDYLSFIISSCIYDPSKIEFQINKIKELKNKKTVIFSDYCFSKSSPYSYEESKYNFYTEEHYQRKNSNLFPLLYQVVKIDTLLIHKSIINNYFNNIIDFQTEILELLFSIFSNSHNSFMEQKLVYYFDDFILKTKSSNNSKKNIFDFYVRVINSLSKKDIKKLAPTKLDFLKDMETIFKNQEMNSLVKFIRSKYMVNIQFAENDLIGNKFNGFDLHRQLRERDIDSKLIVLNKESNDPNTYYFDYFSKDSTKELIKQRMIFESNILHFHHIHKIFDLNYLPVLSNIVPCVITLHEPYFLGGHCVHSFDCDKWKKHCFDCQYLTSPFALDYDYSSLNFELTKLAIQNSQISVIVASDWMVDRVKSSPIWKGKKIYKIPFGIDENIFKPSLSEAAKTRKKLNISNESIVIMFRSSNGKYKGTEIVKKALKTISTRKRIVIVTVDNKNLLDEFKNQYRIIEFGWIKDDYFLASLYQITDIFLMPSTYETFGMMALEAMSCGKMVLGVKSEGSALSEVINSPECGILVDQDKFGETLNRLINNIDEVKKRGLLSMNHVRKNNSLKTFLDGIENAYDDIIKTHVINDEYKLILNQLEKHMPEDSPLIVKPVDIITDDKKKELLSDGQLLKIKKISLKNILNIRELFRKIVPYRIRKIIKNKILYK